MSKHTPGAWRVGMPGPNGCYTVGTERGLMTAMVAHSINYADQRDQAMGDAHLIAAAPDLLEALENMLNNKGHATPDQLRAARDAVAKAKGGDA